MEQFYYFTIVSYLSYSVLLITFIYILTKIVSNAFFQPLYVFPGPFLASFTNLWKVYHVTNGNLEHQIVKAHRKYGKIVRIGPNHLDISDGSAVKGIYGSGRDFLKSSYYDAFGAIKPNLFGMRDEDIHSARRKACANGFSAQSVAAMEPFIDGRLDLLIKRLDRAAEDREIINLKQWIAFFVLDTLGELAFSRPFGILESGNADEMPPIQDHLHLCTMCGQIPWVIPYINKVLPYLPIPALQRMIKGRMALRNMAIKSVNDRLTSSSSSHGKDLLGRLLDEFAQGVDSKGRTLDITDIQTEAAAFIVGGSHTTASTTTLLFWHLFHNPDILAKLQAEIHGVPSEPEASHGCYPYSKLANLQYLQAVITENYRISPILTMPLMRIVPSGGRILAGHFVPANTDVSICNLALHHDPAVFGANLEKFIPERWLDKEYSRAKTQFLMPFGAGHRACLGRNIAVVEICKMVVSLLKRFEFEYISSGEGFVSKIPPTKSVGVSELQGGLNVRVRSRMASCA